MAASDWKPVAGLTLSERYSDNVDLRATGGRSAFITQVSPTLGLSRQGKRGSVNLTYSLNGLLYDSGKNELSHALGANMQVEPVTGVFKVSGNAQVSQQYASQFSAVSQDTYHDTANRVETRSVSLTPSLHNEFFERSLITDVSLGLSAASAGSGSLATSTGTNLNFSAKNGPRPNRLTYTANVTRNSSNANGVAGTVVGNEAFNVGYAVYERTRVFVGGGRNSSSGLAALQGQGSSYSIAGVSWNPVNYFTATVTAGQSGDTSTFGLSGNWAPNSRFSLGATAGKRNNANTYSLSGNWMPSVLTSLSASAQQNFDNGTFGVDTANNGLSAYGQTAYALSLSHRVRRTVLGVNYSESVVNASQQFSQTVAFPFYQCGSQFQPVVLGQPMPTGCTPVKLLVPFTQLTNQTTLNKTLAGTLGVSSGRSNYALTMSQSTVQTLSNSSLSGSVASGTEQTGLGATWSLSLSGRTSTSLAANWTTARGAQNASNADLTSDSYAIYWTLAHQISPHVTSSFNARHSEQRTSAAATGSIKENTVSAQLGMTF